MVRKNVNRDLGRSLANGKQKERAARDAERKEKTAAGGSRHTLNESSRPQLVSILQSSNLDELMLNAEMANRTFEAERYPGPLASNEVRVVTPLHPNTSAEAEQKRKKTKELDASSLRIPRRPKWDASTSAHELKKAEEVDFYTWRKRIAEVEEEVNGHDNLALTPFEKNLEVWRQLWRVVERSDVVVQIVDARNPLLYYCEDLTRLAVDEMGRNHMLVLNKSDLLSSGMITKWEKYFGDRGIDVVFFSAFKSSVGEEMDDERVIGAKELIARFSRTSRTAPVTRENQRVVAGMCGYPNVGKSSTINVLLDTASEVAEQVVEEDEQVTSKRVAVSATPGRTKHFQTLPLTDELMLCDCPGLVFPNFSASKSELICAGVLSIDNMRSDTIVPIELIARRVPAAIFEGIYGIRFITDKETLLDEGASEKLLRTKGRVSATLLLETHARARGFMTAGHGLPDKSRSARVVLRDYVSGRVRFAHAPPPRGEEDGESGVGPEVFAKKGKLVKARTDAAAAGTNILTSAAANVSTKVQPYDETGVLDLGGTKDEMKHVVARISTGKKQKRKGAKQFTRVERTFL